MWIEYGPSEEELVEDSEGSEGDQTETEAATTGDSTDTESESGRHEDGNKDADLSSFEIKE